MATSYSATGANERIKIDEHEAIRSQDGVPIMNSDGSARSTQPAGQQSPPKTWISSPYQSGAQRQSVLSNTSTLKKGDPGEANATLSDSEHENEDADVEKQGQKDDKGEDEEKDPNVVDWDGPDDPQNPMNWPPYRKWSIAVVMGLMTLVVTFASSVFSSATMVTAKQFGVSSEVMILGVALFVLGFAFGPIVWGELEPSKICRVS
jgi:hypothetical protein